MNRYLRLLAVSALCLCSTPGTTQAQMGRPGKPLLNPVISKLFGDNTTFAANMNIEAPNEAGGPVSMPAKISFDQGKSRLEMDVVKGMASKLPPEVATQMRTMGADLTVVVTRPDKKSTYLIYPHMKAYAELAMDAESAAEKPDQFKVETTELAKETVDGHACVKNKVTLTDDKGVKHESTVWNATDLKKFPVKIDSNEDGHAFTLTFKDVKLASVDKDAFDAPDGYTKYNDMQSMMSQEMMKHMPKGGGQ